MPIPKARPAAAPTAAQGRPCTSRDEAISAAMLPGSRSRTREASGTADRAAPAPAAAPSTRPRNAAKAPARADSRQPTRQAQRQPHGGAHQPQGQCRVTGLGGGPLLRNRGS